MTHLLCLPSGADSSNHASNGVGMHAAGNTKKLYTVNLSDSNYVGTTSESGDGEAEVAKTHVGQENGADQVDCGEKKHLPKKKPVNCTCTITYMDIHIHVF